MALDLNQERKLKELRELYKYDKALAKQSGCDFESKEAELEVLATLHFSRSIQKHLEEFVESIQFDGLNHLVIMGVVCNEALGKIAGKLELECGREAIDQALALVDRQREVFRNTTRVQEDQDEH